ncbi:MAG: DUF1697 domain-containing protein [Flavobacteriales bacterium]|nr:DUF1697 domain-containing protein [Flavobacteriales bacterium]
MSKRVALLRGVNVSGKNLLKMAELRRVLGSSGFNDVETYIQSGNIIFDHPLQDSTEIEEEIRKSIFKEFGLSVPVIVKTKPEWEDAIHKMPYDLSSGIDTKKLMVTFLREKPDLNILNEMLEKFGGNDQVVAVGRQLYLYCPNGLGQSKLTNNLIEQKLRQEATSRNWNTMHALMNLLS